MADLDYKLIVAMLETYATMTHGSDPVRIAEQASLLRRKLRESETARAQGGDAVSDAVAEIEGIADLLADSDEMKLADRLAKAVETLADALSLPHFAWDGEHWLECRCPRLADHDAEECPPEAALSTPQPDAVQLLRDIAADTTWRSNDNSLWPRIQAAVRADDRLSAQGAAGAGEFHVGESVIWTSKFGKDFEGVVTAINPPKPATYDVDLVTGACATAPADKLRHPPQDERGEE